MSPVVAVVGTIAGAGATTTVTALGTALAEQRRRVALVDATAEGSRLADVLDLEDDGDLADALRRGTTVADVQGSGPHDVAAFPAAPETSWGSMRPDAVATLYDQLRERFEFVLVDCGSDLSPARSAWLGHADEVVVVTDPDVAGAVPETAALAGAFGVPVRGVVANRVRLKEVDDAVEALGETDLPVLGVLPEDPTVGIAADAGDSVLRTEPDSPIASVAWDLALRFRQRDHEEPVLPAGVGRPPSATTGDPTSGAGGSADEPTPAADEVNGDPTSGIDDTADGLDPDDDATDDTIPDDDATDDPIPDDDATDDPIPDDDAADEPMQAADDAIADRDEAAASAPGSPTSAQPAPAPDDTGASQEGTPEAGDAGAEDPSTSTTSQASGGSTTAGSPDRSGGSGSEGREGASDDEDPFTSPEPQAVEDDEAASTEGEGGASAPEPQGSLLSDVRAHIEDRESDDQATGSGNGDRSRGDAVTEADSSDGTADVGSSERPTDLDSSERTTDLGSSDVTGDHDPTDDADGSESADDEADTGPGADGSLTDSLTDRESAGEGTSDRTDDGTDDDSAALSDEEIESLFAETMERVKGRQESEGEEKEEEGEEDDD
jgi:septum site-determining protein MinD